MPTISVIVVNYNGDGYLKTCVDSLLTQSFGDFEAIIIDNASTDGSIETLPALPNHFQIVRETENLGFAKANNKGAHLATGTWIALLNPDAVAAPDWLEKLLAAVTLRPNYRIVASAQFDMTNSETLDGSGDCYSICGYAWRGGYGLKKSELPPAGEVFAACGASAFYPRDAFLAAGGFDESYFCFIEDVDLGFRLRLAGEKCQFDPSCRVSHAGGAITGQLSSFSLFHSIRNTMWTVIKNMPGPLLLITAPLWIFVTSLLIMKAGPLHRKALLAGLRAAFTDIAGPLKARKTIQRQKKIGWMAVAEMVSWNLGALRAHLPIVNPFATQSAKLAVKQQ